ncbi:MAG: APC family permease [Pseudomonadota bacterium]
MKRTTTTLTLVMINIAAIGALNNLPTLAAVGFSSIIYYLIAMAFFFIPYSLIVAELASGFPNESGIYIWVKTAFGSRVGFIAVWLQWIENIFWYPTILSFIAAALTYCFDPSLASNKIYNVIATLSIYWGLTIANLFGVNIANLISRIGSSFGILIPGILIVGFGLYWFNYHQPTHLVVGWQHLFPNLKDYANLAFLVGIAQTLAGLEMSSVQSTHVVNPRRAFPLAILFSTVIVCSLSILGSLAIAAMVPATEIDLNNGVIQAFMVMMNGHFYLLTLISILVACGGMTAASAWIMGPSSSLVQAAKDDCIPHFFCHLNPSGVSTPVLITQGIVVSLLCGMFLLMPTVSSAYWLLTVIAGQLYLVMYLLMFAAAVKIRNKKSITYTYHIGDVKNTYIISAIGAVGCVAFILLGFIPPLHMQESPLFIAMHLLICLAMLGLPFLIYSITKRNAKKLRALEPAAWKEHRKKAA